MTAAGFLAMSVLAAVVLCFVVVCGCMLYDRNRAVRARVLKRRDDIFYVRLWLAATLSLVIGLPLLIIAAFVW